MTTDERRGLLAHVTPKTHFDVGAMGDSHERDQAKAVALVVIADVLTELIEGMPKCGHGSIRHFCHHFHGGDGVTDGF